MTACAKVAHVASCRAVLETWNDISTQFATYEIVLERITRLVASRSVTRRLTQKMITVAHFLWPIHIRFIHMTAKTRLSMVKETAAC